MLKLIGILLVLSGSIGVGMEYRSQVSEHVRQLLEFQSVLQEIGVAREYLHLPYGQILEKSARGKSTVVQSVCGQIAEQIIQQKQADLKVIWMEAMKAQKGSIQLTEEEQTVCAEIGRSLCLEGQQGKVSEVYFIQLEHCLVQAMEEKKEKQKIYGILSVSVGIFLVVILL